MAVLEHKMASGTLLTRNHFVDARSIYQSPSESFNLPYKTEYRVDQETGASLKNKLQGQCDGYAIYEVNSLKVVFNPA